MKVGIGEYLRLDNGCIYKWESNDYERIYEEDGQLVYGNGANEYEWECNIKKHSFNIIDLIEVGDYVNGRKIYQVGYNFQDNLVLKMSIDKNGNPDNYEDFIYEDDIKSIVTKEQFGSIEYKVGD